MSERAPYSRVYWSIIDDEKFAEVYDSDRALACWLRLLIAADAIWPAPASIPATSSKTSVALLVRVGLVDLQAGGRYRIHGLDAERGIRRLAATRLRLGQDPTGDQPVPNREPVAFEVPGRSLAEPSRAKPSQAEPAREPALDAYQAIMVNVSKDALTFLDDLVAAHGQEATARAIGEASLKGKDKLLSRTKTLLVLRERRAGQAEAAEERQRVAAHRAPVVREVQPEETPEQRAAANAQFTAIREQLASKGVVRRKPAGVGPVSGVLT